MVALLNEIERIATHQGLDRKRLLQAVDALSPYLDRYAELVVTERGMEIISGGIGIAQTLGNLALEWGAPRSTVDAFIACDAAFPGTMLGIKLCLGPDADAPTLYVRSKSSMNEGMAFIDSIMPSVTVPLAEALASSHVLYGLGFTSYGGDMAIKTYTLDGEGFLSLRAWWGEVIAEHKHYLPEVPWGKIDVPNAKWRDILSLGTELGYERAGHVAWTSRPDSEPELKLYVERIGAIPTDFSGR